VAQRFVEKEGKQIRRCNFMLQHKENDFMLANVDRLIVGENAGLECKTTSLLTRTDYEAGEIPPYYHAQCVHYMAVTGATHWYIAILVLNKAFYVHKIERNEDEIKTLIQNERSFWVDHILANFPPEADGSERAGKVIQQLYKGDNHEPYVLLYGLEDSVRQIRELDEKVKELSREEERLKQAIELEMKESTMGKVEGFVVNYAKYSRTSVDSKRLKSEKPDIYNEYLKTIGYRKFEIKPIRSGFNWITQ
jgi:predicted phage-related endonuclease